MRTDIAAALLAAVLGCCAAPGAAAVLTHDAAVAQALQRAPQILVAEASLAAAAAAARQAPWPSNPELEIEAENVFGDGPYSDFDAAETTITLRQPVALGGKRGARIDAARARLEQARAEVELARRATRRDVTIAYANAVLTDRVAALARARRVDAEALRAAAERRLAAGLISELQYSQAVLAGAQAAAALNHAQADAASARRQLARWLGAAEIDGIAAGFDADWFDRPPQAGAATAEALSDAHPLLRARRAALDAAVAAQRLEDRAVIPDPVLSLGARRFADAPAGEDRALVLGMSLPLPLWDRKAAERAGARRERIVMETELDAARRDLTDALAQARAMFNAAAGELRALMESAAPAARRAAELARLGFEAGRLSLAERLQADQALQSTEEGLQRARFTLHQSQAQLDYLLTVETGTRR